MELPSLTSEMQDKFHSQPKLCARRLLSAGLEFPMGLQ